jgi:hypothetical protein
MSYDLDMCSSSAVIPATGGNSVCTYVFVFSSTEKYLPLRAPLPLGDTAAALPHAHFIAPCPTEQVVLATCLLAGSCWNYFFDPEDGGDMFLRNVVCNSTDYTASYPRRWCSSSCTCFQSVALLSEEKARVISMRIRCRTTMQSGNIALILWRLVPLLLLHWSSICP